MVAQSCPISQPFYDLGGAQTSLPRPESSLTRRLPVISGAGAQLCGLGSFRLHATQGFALRRPREGRFANRPYNLTFPRPAGPASTGLSLGEREWDRHSCLSLRLAQGAPPRRQECLRHFISRSVTGEGSFSGSSRLAESQNATSKAKSNSNGKGQMANGLGFEESANCRPFEFWVLS
jgi:hypothetical protein